MISELFDIDSYRYCKYVTSVSYCMVCATVQEDNPHALASGLSPVQTHKPYNNILIAPASRPPIHLLHCKYQLD